MVMKRRGGMYIVRWSLKGDEDPPKKSHFDLVKTIKDKDIPSPVASFLLNLLTGGNGSGQPKFFPVAWFGELGVDAECFPFGAGKIGGGAGIILRGEDKGKLFGHINDGYGVGFM